MRCSLLDACQEHDVRLFHDFADAGGGDLAVPCAAVLNFQFFRKAAPAVFRVSSAENMQFDGSARLFQFADRRKPEVQRFPAFHDSAPDNLQNSGAFFLSAFPVRFRSGFIEENGIPVIDFRNAVFVFHGRGKNRVGAAERFPDAREEILLGNVDAVLDEIEKSCFCSEHGKITPRDFPHSSDGSPEKDKVAGEFPEIARFAEADHSELMNKIKRFRPMERFGRAECLFLPDAVMPVEPPVALTPEIFASFFADIDIMEFREEASLKCGKVFFDGFPESCFGDHVERKKF